jgi:hypothetical protein
MTLDNIVILCSVLISLALCLGLVAQIAWGIWSIRCHRRAMRLFREQRMREKDEWLAKLHDCHGVAVRLYERMTPEEREQNPTLLTYMERSTWIRR